MKNPPGVPHVESDELFDYLGGWASPESVCRIEQALADDPELQTELGRLEGALTAYRGTDMVPLGPAEEDSLVQRATAQMPQVPWRWRPRGIYRISLSAAIVASGLLLGVILHGRFNRQHTEQAAQHSAHVYAADWKTQMFAVAEQGTVNADSGQPLGLAIGRTMRVALQPSTRVKVDHSRPKRKTVTVKRGVVVVAVHGRAVDERVRVRTPAGTVHVTGTVFFVAVEGSRTRVGVGQGKTRFVLPNGSACPVEAGDELILQGDSVTRRPLGAGGLALLSTPTRSIDERKALSEGDASPTKATMVTAEDDWSPAQGDAAVGRGADGGAVDGSSHAPRRNGVAPRDESADLPGADAATMARSLYERVEQALSQRDPLEAENRLLRLLEQRPPEPWLRLALFDLARLREHALGDPQGAIDAYRRYLATGPQAPLAAEARRALARLGAQLSDRR